MLKSTNMTCGRLPKNVKINLNEMPKYQQDAMCKTILSCTKKFFENPEVQADFERWKKERERV